MKLIPGMLVVVVSAGAIILGFWWISGNGDGSSNTENRTGTFTVSEVAEHNSASDCWTIIDGNVYNLTSFIPSHPGGDEILRACGTDATMLFRQRTTEDGETVGSGVPHSSVAESQLTELQIGTLAQ